MDLERQTAEGPYAEALRGWVPPSPAEWARFEEKAAALHGAASIAGLALAPAGLAVFLPLLNLDTPWSTIVAGGLWTLSAAVIFLATVLMCKARRMQVWTPGVTRQGEPTKAV